jgi:hypothetical protein
MAGLNFTTVLWFIGPATLSAGQSVEYTITYPGGGSVMSINAVDTLTAMNQRFSYQTTGIVIHGASEDAPPQDTTYFFTVTNESEGEGAGEFFFVLEAIYY